MFARADSKGEVLNLLIRQKLLYEARLQPVEETGTVCPHSGSKVQLCVFVQ